MKKLLKARCIHCNKEIYSIYKKQLIHNKNVHEQWCRFKKIKIKVEASKPNKAESPNS